MGELVQKLILEMCDWRQNAEGIEYRNGLIYKNGKIYLGLGNGVTQKMMITKVHTA